MPNDSVSSQNAASDQLHSTKPITILTWNYLGNGLAQTGEFKTDPIFLEWNYRYPRIVTEIRDIKPDIFSLQEATHSGELAMEFPDYSLFFVPKIQSAALKGGSPPDGVAVFVDRDRFDVLDVQIVYFKYIGDLTLRYQNAIILTLREVASATTFVLSSTHLKAKSGLENDALRLHQTEQLISRLEEQASKLGPETPVIVCGDFNSTPHQLAYPRIMSSTLNFMSAYNSQPSETGQSNQGASAGQAAATGHRYGGGEPAFTTWKFRANEVEKKETIALPSEAQIGPGALPSAAFPSDHLSLAAQFEFSPPASAEGQTFPVCESPQLSSSDGNA